MSTNPETLTSPTWNSHRVLTCNGNGDTHIHTGEDYRTIALADLFALEPTSVDKDRGAAIIPSIYHDYDGRNHAVQRAKGQFVALCADVDSGDHPKATITKAMAEFARGCACLIYSSPHARPGDKRWRIIVPLDAPVPFDTWHDAQNAFFNFLALRDIEADRALARCGQLVYLPNVPEIHSKTGTALRTDGKPLYYQTAKTKLTNPGIDLTAGNIAAGIAAIRTRRAADEQERERIRAEMERRRASAPRGDGANLIEDFNASNSVATMLEMCGYENSPVSAEDWRSPVQTSTSYATRIIGSKWVSLSASDAASGLGERCAAGCYGDAYDLFVHFKHGGDHKAAFRAMYAERRDANVIYPARFEEPPAWMDEAPLPDEMPDWCSAEPDFDPVTDMTEFDVSDTDTFELLDIDELENLPPPQWLVKDLVVEDGLTILYGDPGSCKSFISLDMSLRLTLGMDWHGLDAKQTGVLYIAGEGARGLGKRVKGWRREHRIGDAKSPFLLLPVPVALLEPDQRFKLLRTIDEAKRRAGFDIGLVVIDTVSRSLAGAGENGADEMGAFVAACDVVRMHTGGAVLGVHHSGKDKDKGMRGSSVLLGACDGTIRVEKSEDLVTLTTEKQKDAEQSAPVYMTMKQVSWPAPDGDQTTLVPYRTETTRESGLSREWIAQAFGIMADAWGVNRPLSHRPQTQRDGRYAPAIFARKLGGDADVWARHIALWLENGCLSIEVADKHLKVSGLRVLDAVL